MDAILQAYEARLKPNLKTMKEWAEEYTNPVEQKSLLGLFTRIVEVTQSLSGQQEKDKKEQENVIAKSKKLPNPKPIRIETSQNKLQTLDQEPKLTPTFQDRVVPNSKGWIGGYYT